MTTTAPLPRAWHLGRREGGREGGGGEEGGREGGVEGGRGVKENGE